MAVLRLASDKGFVDLDDAHKLAEILIGEAGAYAVAHIPSCLVRTEAHIAIDLQRTDFLLTRQHQVDDAEPLTERFIRVLEDRANQYREPVSSPGSAGIALPMKWPRVGFDFGIAATRANDKLRPAVFGEIEFAGVIIREHDLEVPDRHVMDALLLRHVRHHSLNRREI